MDKSKAKLEHKRLLKEYKKAVELAENSKMPLARAAYQKKVVRLLNALIEIAKLLPTPTITEETKDNE